MDDIEINPLDIRKPSIAQVSIIYSIVTFLFIALGMRVQHAEFYSGILITEFGLVLIPPLLLIFLKKYSVKKVLRLNGISFINILLIPIVMIFSLPVVGVLNVANLYLIKFIFGKISIQELPIFNSPPTLYNILLNLFVTAVAAGICEELLFRGVIQRGFERFGTAFSILFTAFLFGLMHMDFQKLLGTFLLGALIGFIVYRTNSLFAGMLAHFTNNAIAVVIGYAAKSLQEIQKLQDKATSNPLQAHSLIIIIIAIVMLVIVFSFLASMFLGSLWGLIKSTKYRVEHIIPEMGSRKLGMLWLIPGILVVLLFYFIHGIRLLNLNIELVNKIINIIT